MENVPSGQVQTVLGPVDPSTLGITLTHEHLIIDLTQVLPHMLTVPGVKNVPDIYSDKLSQENIGLARYHFAPNEDKVLRKFQIEKLSIIVTTEEVRHKEHVEKYLEHILL